MTPAPVSERRIAANRRNAQRSTGPRTPAGKARSARNACVHRARSRQHPLPETWDQEFRAQAQLLVAATPDPVRRSLEFDFAYYILWHNRLIAQETLVLEACFRRFPSGSRRGAHLFTFDPGVRAFRRHLNRVNLLIGRALRALCAHIKSRAIPDTTGILASVKKYRQTKPTHPTPPSHSDSVSQFIRVHPRPLFVARSPAPQSMGPIRSLN